MCCCLRSFVVLAAVASAVPLKAQTRFPGDSPTRGVPIGTPGAGSRSGSGSVPTFTIPQRGFGRSIGVGIGVTYGYPFGGFGYNRYYGRHFYGPTYGYGPYGYYGLCPFCGGRYGYCGCRGPIYYPPVVVDSRGSYGPGGVLNFYGIDPPTPTAPQVADNRPFVPPQRNNAQTPEALRPANPQAAAKPVAPQVIDGGRARAWRYIDLGDRDMKRGDYRAALSLYKKAIRSDSDLAAPQFRLMFAYLGLGNLDRAAEALRAGLRLDPAWPHSDFVLDDLFPGNEKHRPALVAITKQLDQFPNDAQARLLAGVVLHFDAQPRAAEQQFRRAIKLAGDDSAARLFLPPPREADEDPN